MLVRPRVPATVILCLASLAAALPAADFLLWTVSDHEEHHFVRRSAPDGSNPVDLVDGVGSLRGLAVDAAGGALYWIEFDPSGSRIVRAGLDGKGRQLVHQTKDFLTRIVLDAEAGMLYFTASGGSGVAGIRRVSTAGGNSTGVIDREVDDLAVDGAGGMIYWAQEGLPGEYGTSIWRAPLDGTADPEPIIHHPFDHYTTGIALDVPRGKIYWATVDYRDTKAQIVQRANLDGTGVEPVTTANPVLDDWPVFLALDAGEGKLYWVNGEDHEFYRVSLEGGEAERLFEEADTYGPYGLAVLSSEAPPAPRFRRGDADGDGAITVTDPIITLEALFLGGSPPGCADAADVNDDGALDLSDAVAALTYQFLGGFAIPPPGPLACGADPELPADDLGCRAYASCPR